MRGWARLQPSCQQQQVTVLQTCQPWWLLLSLFSVHCCFLSQCSQFILVVKAQIYVYTCIYLSLYADKSMLVCYPCKFSPVQRDIIVCSVSLYPGLIDGCLWSRDSLLELIYVTPRSVNTHWKTDNDFKLFQLRAKSFCEVWAGDSSALSFTPTYGGGNDSEGSQDNNHVVKLIVATCTPLVIRVLTLIGSFSC